jgi:hypothetical protein
MIHTNKFFIKYAIDKVTDNIEECEYSSKIISFWNSFKGEKVSYMGFNFEGNEVTSVKFYFVVFADSISINDFPISELYQMFENNIENRSPLVLEKFSNGGGITFSIKVKLINDNIEYGYYLRCLKLMPEEKELIDSIDIPFGVNLLSESLGVYNTIDSLKCRTEIYGYLNPIDLYPAIQQHYVQFENIRGVEIAKLNNPQNFKYVYIGGDALFKDRLIALIPKEVITFKEMFHLNLVCPAFNQHHNLCSVYLTDFANNSILPSINYLSNFINSHE